MFSLSIDFTCVIYELTAAIVTLAACSYEAERRTASDTRFTCLGKTPMNACIGFANPQQLVSRETRAH
jgi:hypothetical protein